MSASPVAKKTSNIPNDFLNPNSMLTPGIAGGTTTLLTTTLHNQFGLPLNWTGLVISFLCGALIVQAALKKGLLLGIVYYVLNSLIIFAVALGTNQAAVHAPGVDQPPANIPRDINTAKPYFSSWLDHTPAKRQEILAQIDDIKEDDAKKTLSKLNVAIPEKSSAPQVLKWYAASRSTAGQLGAINAALPDSDRSERAFD